jgi:hypothetical protein
MLGSGLLVVVSAERDDPDPVTVAPAVGVGGDRAAPPAVFGRVRGCALVASGIGDLVLT